ncbi:putative DnaJ-class molecular chaperone [Paenibacillus alvei]|uniref:Putative DnaJ-class molecular chaperone n=2 Tax=Paenibacillus alvei TaxID=44250 RepID=A0A383RMS5_PAEAL|nr:putative DnaJ-class molecular chaperone [Paenibacillus alvei]
MKRKVEQKDVGAETSVGIECKESNEAIEVTDPYLISIVNAIEQLTESWSAKLKNGGIKLQLAVQIGSSLSVSQQEWLMEFLQDFHVRDLEMSKVLHAFATELPEWATRQILQLFRKAERVKAVLIARNDVMDQLEQRMRQMEYDFWQGMLPTDENELEHVLSTWQRELAAWEEEASRERNTYNRTYGDSSRSSVNAPSAGKDKDLTFHTLIGVPEEADAKQVRKQSRKLLRVLHPDHGGSAYLFTWVKEAYDAYQASRIRRESPTAR